MNLTENELKALGFRRAGTVHPDSAKTLRVKIDWDVRGFVVYAMVVNDEVKKFGTAGTKGSSFSQRMRSEFTTVRQVIVGPTPGRPVARWRSRPFDPFKEHAPATILAR